MADPVKQEREVIRVEFNIPDTLARNAIPQPIFIFADMD